MDELLRVNKNITLTEWVEKAYGEDVALEGIAVSGNTLIATISYPETVFPFFNVQVPINRRLSPR